MEELSVMEAEIRLAQRLLPKRRAMKIDNILKEILQETIQESVLPKLYKKFKTIQ